METKIPYYFIWSQSYEYFAQMLKQCIACYSNILEDRSIFVEQSVFDEKIYKTPNAHFLQGCFIKLEKTYELLCTLPENSYFIFSDADVILFPNKKLNELLNLYIATDIDIVFMREGASSRTYNIGFSLIKVCDENRRLFQTVLELCKESPNELDQTLVNKALKSYNGTYHFFPTEFVCTTCVIADYNTKKNIALTRDTYMIFQAISDPTLPKEQMIYDKLSQYKLLGIPIEFV